MANRYWVGGTGSWDATTTHWSATSGGASGASVPTSVDDVFFDTLSNATLYTCTLTTSPVCRSVSVVGPATGNVTIAGATNWVVYGSVTIAATGVTWTYSSNIFFTASTTGFTVTTNGVSLAGGLVFQGTGSGYTLGSALTCSGAITFSAGTFSTANFNITTTNNFTLTGASARTLNLGSSAISCASWSALGATNLTVNAGTSTITVTGASGTFNGGGLTYYNVTKATNGFAIGDAGNTFNALTHTTISVAGTYLCSFAGNQTIGTLTVNGGAGGGGIVGRASIQSLTPGTQVTLTVATFVTNGYIDFRDINFQGAASPLTVATGGDCGNNTNITLQTPKTVYWNFVGGGVWSSTAWATTSGGTPAIANFPLPQDTVIIDNTGLTSGNTITINNTYNFGTIDMSTRTLPMTFAVSNSAANIYGDFTLSSSVTTTATTGSLTFSGFNKTQTITSAGVSFANALTVNNPTVTVTLADNLTTTSATAFSVLSGTLNLNGKTLTASLFSSTGALTRNITFGGGTMTVSGATFTASGTNQTTTGSGIINMTSASSKTFAGGGFSYPTLNQSGSGALVITGANTFANITNTVQPATVTFPASTITTVANFNLNGTSGNLITLNSSTVGTQATLLKVSGGSVDVGYLSIKDSNATPLMIWYAGTTSTDAGNNTGWTFTAAPSVTIQEYPINLRSFTEPRRF